MRRIGKGLSTTVLAMVLMLSCSLLVFADTAYITTSDGGSVNMRAEASTDSDVVNFLDDGTEVEVLGTEGDWTQVSYDGYTGYVMSSFLTTAESDTASDTEADTAADTDADTTNAASDTATDTAVDTAAAEAADDTTAAETEEEEEEIEAETSDDENTALSEKLAKYKKLVMILALACLILVIIIINLLLFYRRGYDDDGYDDDYDDEDDDGDDDDDDDDRYYDQKRGQYGPERKRQAEPVKQQEVDVPDISGMVNDTAAEAYGQTSPTRMQNGSAASIQDEDDGDLEFFDLDDL